MDEAEEFKKEREEKFGGVIRFMSYARFIGEARSEKLLNRGGILYIIKDTIHFEDFERQNSLMALVGQKQKYSKTEFSIELSEISIVKEIKEKYANNCVVGLVDENEILPAPAGIMAIFSKTSMQLLMKGKKSLFFDFLDKEGFMAIVNEYMLKPE